jgi:hypothetical protein
VEHQVVRRRSGTCGLVPVGPVSDGVVGAPTSATFSWRTSNRVIVSSEAPRVVDAVAADQANASAGLVREHPPAVDLLSKIRPSRWNGARASVGCMGTTAEITGEQYRARGKPDRDLERVALPRNCTQNYGRVAARCCHGKTENLPIASVPLRNLTSSPS